MLGTFTVSPPLLVQLEREHCEAIFLEPFLLEGGTKLIWGRGGGGHVPQMMGIMIIAGSAVTFYRP